MSDYLLQLQIENGYGYFTPSAEWIGRMAGDTFCPHCENTYESVDHIDGVVINPDRLTDVDFIWQTDINVLSAHFIEVVGIQNLQKFASFGRLFDERGILHEGHRTIISHENRVIIRGMQRSKTSQNIGVCGECKRLLYWPMGGEYVLRQELPRLPLFISDSDIFCTPEFYEKKFAMAMLRHVATRKIRILDEPLDGLPASTKELRSLLLATRQFK